MTIDWARLGLKEPREYEYGEGYDGTFRQFEWMITRSGDKNPELVIRNGPNLEPFHLMFYRMGQLVSEFPATIEDAAAQLIKLGCGKESA